MLEFIRFQQHLSDRLTPDVFGDSWPSVPTITGYDSVAAPNELKWHHFMMFALEATGSHWSATGSVSVLLLFTALP